MASQKDRGMEEGMLCLQAVFQVSKLRKIKQMFKSNILNHFVAEYLLRKFVKLFVSLVALSNIVQAFGFAPSRCGSQNLGLSWP